MIVLSVSLYLPGMLVHLLDFVVGGTTFRTQVPLGSEKYRVLVGESLICKVISLSLSLVSLIETGGRCCWMAPIKHSKVQLY